MTALPLTGSTATGDMSADASSEKTRDREKITADELSLGRRIVAQYCGSPGLLSAARFDSHLTASRFAAERFRFLNEIQRRWTSSAGTYPARPLIYTSLIPEHFLASGRGEIAEGRVGRREPKGELSPETRPILQAGSSGSATLASKLQPKKSRAEGAAPVYRQRGLSGDQTGSEFSSHPLAPEPPSPGPNRRAPESGLAELGGEIQRKETQDSTPVHGQAGLSEDHASSWRSNNPFTVQMLSPRLSAPASVQPGRPESQDLSLSEIVTGNYEDLHGASAGSSRTHPSGELEVQPREPADASPVYPLPLTASKLTRGSATQAFLKRVGRRVALPPASTPSNLRSPAPEAQKKIAMDLDEPPSEEPRRLINGAEFGPAILRRHAVQSYDAHAPVASARLTQRSVRQQSTKPHEASTGRAIPGEDEAAKSLMQEERGSTQTQKRSLTESADAPPAALAGISSPADRGDSVCPGVVPLGAGVPSKNTEGATMPPLAVTATTLKQPSYVQVHVQTPASRAGDGSDLEGTSSGTNPRLAAQRVAQVARFPTADQIAVGKTLIESFDAAPLISNTMRIRSAYSAPRVGSSTLTRGQHVDAKLASPFLATQSSFRLRSGTEAFRSQDLLSYGFPLLVARSTATNVPLTTERRLLSGSVVGSDAELVSSKWASRGSPADRDRSKPGASTLLSVIGVQRKTVTVWGNRDVEFGRPQRGASPPEGRAFGTATFRRHLSAVGAPGFAMKDFALKGGKTQSAALTQTLAWNPSLPHGAATLVGFSPSLNHAQVVRTSAQKAARMVLSSREDARSSAYYPRGPRTFPLVPTVHRLASATGSVGSGAAGSSASSHSASEVMAHVSRRSVFAQRAALPPDHATTQPAPSLPVSAGFPGSPVTGSPGVDIAQLADHVYNLLVRRIANERERRGV